MLLLCPMLSIWNWSWLLLKQEKCVKRLDTSKYSKHISTPGYMGCRVAKSSKYKLVRFEADIASSNKLVKSRSSWVIHSVSILFGTRYLLHVLSSMFITGLHLLNIAIIVCFSNYDMFLLFKPLAQRSAVGYTLFDGAVKCGGKWILCGLFEQPVEMAKCIPPNCRVGLKCQS